MNPRRKLSINNGIKGFKSTEKNLYKNLNDYKKRIFTLKGEEE